MLAVLSIEQFDAERGSIVSGAVTVSVTVKNGPTSFTFKLIQTDTKIFLSRKGYRRSRDDNEPLNH